MISQFDCNFPWINSKLTIRQSFESSDSLLSNDAKIVEFDEFDAILQAILVAMIILTAWNMCTVIITSNNHDMIAIPMIRFTLKKFNEQENYQRNKAFSFHH